MLDVPASPRPVRVPARGSKFDRQPTMQGPLAEEWHPSFQFHLLFRGFGVSKALRRADYAWKKPYFSNFGRSTAQQVPAGNRQITGQ